jgi:uncharacterized protein YdeI (YjbR/CyaY-like superfamily)
MPVRSDFSAIFYPQTRQEWRDWLMTHGKTQTEVWLETYNKASGKPTLPYDDMVEECLCFGWIDGVVKKYQPESMVQRITPRRKKSFLSELNRQRIWKLQALGLMTPAGIEPIASQIGSPSDPFEIPTWVLEQLQADPQVWANFQAFPRLYQRLKMGWIAECGPSRREEAQKRLSHLLKMTAQGKQYGTNPLAGMEI